MRTVVVEVAPAATVVLVALAAAWPSYSILRKANPGRARSAIGYLLGFFAGVALTVILARRAGGSANEATVATAGILTAFIAPFIGLLHAKLRGPARKRGRRFDPGARAYAARHS